MDEAESEEDDMAKRKKKAAEIVTERKMWDRKDAPLIVNTAAVVNPKDLDRARVHEALRVKKED